MRDFLQFANMIKELRIHITRRLNDVYFFSEITMKEGISHIKLFKQLIKLNCKKENNSDSERLDDWAEGFIKINSILLMKAP